MNNIRSELFILIVFFNIDSLTLNRQRWFINLLPILYVHQDWYSYTYCMLISGVKIDW